MAFNRMGSYKNIDNKNFLSQCIAIIDTSIILLIAQNILKYEDLIFSIGECKPLIPIHVLNELKKLASKATKKGKLAMWALNNIVSKFHVIEIHLDKCKLDQGDCAIVELAKEISKSTKVIVVTADINLKRELMKQNLSTIWYRSAKNKLEPTTPF